MWPKWFANTLLKLLASVISLATWAKRIFYLLNREEAHNALFRDALNKVKNTGSNKDFGITEDSKLYFDLSSPGPHDHDTKIDINPPSFETPIKK